jgi:hypothetical protein
MKRQKIKVKHVKLLQDIRDRHKERTKRQVENQGRVAQNGERGNPKPRIMDDLTTLLNLVDEILSI